MLGRIVVNFLYVVGVVTLVKGKHSGRIYQRKSSRMEWGGSRVKFCSCSI